MFAIRRIDYPFASLEAGDLLLFSRLGDDDGADYVLVDGRVAWRVDLDTDQETGEPCGDRVLANEMFNRAKNEGRVLVCAEDEFMLVDKERMHGGIIAQLRLRNF